MEQLKTQHRIILGDSRAMAEVADESVHLVVTSPPYWQLKDYGHENQIGFNDSYEDYINNLNLVWRECYRVLHEGCRLCVNIGDQFARSVYYGRYKIIPIRTEIIKFCETIGFDYMGAIIWQKVTTVNTSGGATIMGSFPYPRNGIVKLDYEFILLFKKLGDAPTPTSAQKEQAKLTTEEWNSYFYGHWNFPGEKQSKHLATFPEELPRRLIRMFTFPGETVLDPFLGSGTTALAARNLERNSVGYEINHEFVPLIKEKLQIEERDLFGERANGEIIEQKLAPRDFNAEIAKLPYVFKDHVRFDKKIDPRKKTFGSKIDGSEIDTNVFYKINRILAPDCIEMKNGKIVRLLGIKPIAGKEEAVMQFLQEMIGRRKVFPTFDEAVPPNGNEEHAYLYLKNKTFINGHLIKQGLAEVETSYEYKAKTRMLRYYKAAK
jgi:site-specific DNA-methyltransferase (adenine-specific)